MLRMEVGEGSCLGKCHSDQAGDGAVGGAAME